MFTKLSSFSLAPVYALLTDFAQLDNFWDLFDRALGRQYDSISAASLRSQWLAGDFREFPPIEVVSGQVLGNANGAYAISTNTIYLSDRFIASATAQELTAVVLEEFGHFVDAQVNQEDTPGDEGELFSGLVRGVELSPSELTRIQTEDDHAIISLDGQLISVEEAFGATGFIQFGTSLSDIPQGIITDNSDNVYLTGLTLGTFPGNNKYGGQSDAFLAKYNKMGTQLWIQQFGSSNVDATWAISTDGNNIYVTGQTDGSLSGNFNIGSDDAFVAKYNASGAQIWVKQFGSSQLDTAYGISTDSAGNSYSVGATEGILPSNNKLGNTDAFIAKYNASGTQVWIKQFGSSASDQAKAISIDNNNFYVTGYTYGSLQNNGNLGDADAFIAKYNINGTQLWIKQFGTSSTDFAGKINIDQSGNVYVTGTTEGSLPGNSNLGKSDVFIAKYDANGSQIWIKQFGSSGVELVGGIINDSSGNVYLSGTTEGSLSGNSNFGNTDGFLAKYNASGTQLWVKQFGTSSPDAVSGISIDSSNNVFITGLTLGSLPGNTNLGDFDSFVAGFDANGNQLNTSNPLPNVDLSLFPSSVREDGTTNLVYTFTRTGSTTNALTVNYSITGTADSSDYTGATPGTGKTITFAAGSNTATLTLDPIADTTVEPDETVALNLTSGTGYNIGTTNTAVGTITNDDLLSPKNQLTTSIIRFQNTDKPGTYLYAGEQEAVSIRQNNKNFKEEGLAFQVAVEKTDPLMQGFSRFRNTDKGREGTYLFAGDQEAASIRQNYKNFVEEGLAFYTYSAGIGGGMTDFARFQNKDLPGTYLFTGPDETSSVISNYNNFTFEGSAFAAAG